MNKAKGKNIIFRLVAIIIATPFVLFLLLAALLYFPPLQRYAVHRAEKAINEDSGFKISISNIRLSYPFALAINDFLLKNEGDTIAEGGSLSANISLLPLLKGEIEVNYLSIENCKINTHNLIDGTHIAGKIGNFRAVARNIDLIRQEAEIRQLYINDTHIQIDIKKSDSTEDGEKEPTLWKIALHKGKIAESAVSINLPDDTTAIKTSIGQLVTEELAANIADNNYNLKKATLTDGEIYYDKGNTLREESPLDHLAIKNINLSGEEIIYSPAGTKGKISRFTLNQEEGLNIVRGKATFATDTSKIIIPEIEFESLNGSYIKGNATLPLSFEEKRKEETNGGIVALIKKSDITPFLTPEERASIGHLPDSLLNADIKFQGTPERITIDDISLSLPQMARVEARGEIRNILDKKKREGSLTLSVSIENILPLLGEKMNSIAPTPLNINGKATVQGDLLYTDATIDAIGRGEIQGTYDVAKQTYVAKADFKNFGIEKSIPSVPLKEIDARLSLSGRGCDIFDKNTYYQLIANIDTLLYDRYRASNIMLNAFQANTLSLVSLSSTSAQSDLSLIANNRFDSLGISSDINLKIKNLSLKSTGITDEDISGKINLGIKVFSDINETHKLTLSGENITINTKEKTFSPSPLFIDFATSPAESHFRATNGDLSINSTFASGYNKFFAQIEKVKKMLTEARKSENTMYYANDFEKEIPATEIKFECGRQNMLAKYLDANGIKFKDINLTFNLDSIKGLKTKAAIHDFATNDTKLDTMRFSVTQNGDNIKYFAGVRSTAVTPENKKQSFSAALFGNLQKDTLNTKFTLYGNDRNNITIIGTKTLLLPEGLDITFAPKAKFIGRDIFINKDNHINIRKDNNISANVRATDEEDSGLHLYTIDDSTALHDISLEIFNIDLKTLTSMLPFMPDVEGKLYTDVHYRNDSNGIMFSSDIRGDEIVYKNTPLGNEFLEFIYLPKKDDTNIFSLQFSHDEEERINIHGDYNGERLINTEGTITHLPLKIANCIIGDSDININGYIDGDIQLKGDINSPLTDGFIKFDSVYIDAPLFGSKLHPSDEKIAINNSKIKFEEFDIFANDTSPFKINGNIDISKITSPAFDLRMQAKNCELINTPRKRGSILYGKLLLDLNSYITGPMQALKLYGNATILGKTNITYVMDENSIADNNELDGLVEFVNFKDTTKNTAATESLNLGNITMGITLNIEDGAKINADFDTNRTSYITLQGGGRLNMGYTNEEGISLTGQYTLNSGEMKYSLPLIPLKTFTITPGSCVNWTGDIMNPTLNITAVEKMSAPVSIEGAGNQVVAFDVGVVLKNSLDNINLSFTIKAPENAAIQDELNTLDAETLNKYAITMLVTGAYVGSNGGFTVSNALTSFLDAKINDIAGNAMKDVSINVGITDIENSETGDSYMNYSFSFAKRLWNDRFTIIIGGEVNSGESPESEQSFINNVSLEWRITPNGNRYLRIFYDKNYESILEGEITETGVGYVYKRKLDNLKELLFIKKKRATPTNAETPKKE